MKDPRNEREAAYMGITEKMLANGAMEGPYRRTRPMTITKFQRFRRWLQKTFADFTGRFR